MKTLLALSLLIVSPVVFGVPVTVSEKEMTTSEAQRFSFRFSGLDHSGTNGRLDLTLNGDYGDRGETATLQLEGVDGSLVAGDAGRGNGVTANGIRGLSLASSTLFERGSPSWDREFSFLFNMDNGLLNNLLAKGTFA